MRARGERVITQKFIQTGNTGISEDIELHRRIMGIPLQREDLDGTTCPITFTYPASPQLAAEIDNREIDLSLVEKSTGKLLESYDTVLLEGAGGPVRSSDRHLFDDRLHCRPPPSGHPRHLSKAGQYQPHRAEPRSVPCPEYRSGRTGVQPLSADEPGDHGRYAALPETIPQPYLSECRVYRNRNAGRVTRAQNFRNK